MKIKINGIEFKEVPTVCQSCPNYLRQTLEEGLCLWFRKRKRRLDSIPKRCRTLFEKGFELAADGEVDLVIVEKTKRNDESDN
jgi:hypothetical protein